MLLAEAALAEARLLANEGMWKSAVNSAYNAGYYAALAAVKTTGNFPKTHSALRDLFRERVIATGRMDAACGEALDTLYAAKCRAAGEDDAAWSRREVYGVLESAERIVSAILTGRFRR